VSISETEDWRAERDLLLWKEAIDVQPLYRYMVTTNVGNASFACQDFTVDHLDDGRTSLGLRDVWVFDALMNKRIVPAVVIVCRDFEVIDNGERP